MCKYANEYKDIVDLIIIMEPIFFEDEICKVYRGNMEDIIKTLKFDFIFTEPTIQHRIRLPRIFGQNARRRIHQFIHAF